MFGALFFAGQHLLLEALVLGFVPATRQRPRDRTVKHVAALHFHKHFRRASHHVHIIHVQIKKIGRRIQRTQFAINFKWLRLHLRGKIAG